MEEDDDMKEEDLGGENMRRERAEAKKKRMRR
jgi:hypothetical protein